MLVFELIHHHPHDWIIGKSHSRKLLHSFRIKDQNLSQVNPLSLDKTIYQIAQLITVKVLAGDTTGSGILVKKQGDLYTVITNRHVLESGEKYRVQTPDGKLYPALASKTISWVGKDIGLLHFYSPTKSYQLAALGNSNSLNIGDEVVASGFSSQFDSRKAGGFVFTQGKVIMLPHKPFWDGYQIGYSNDIKVGMSGGPVINKRGEVIGLNGMHAYPLWENPFMYEDGSLPSKNVQEMARSLSWALPIQLVLDKINGSFHK